MPADSSLSVKPEEMVTSASFKNPRILWATSYEFVINTDAEKLRLVHPSKVNCNFKLSLEQFNTDLMSPPHLISLNYHRVPMH